MKNDSPPATLRDYKNNFLVFKVNVIWKLHTSLSDIIAQLRGVGKRSSASSAEIKVYIDDEYHNG